MGLDVVVVVVGAVDVVVEVVVEVVTVVVMVVVTVVVVVVVTVVDVMGGACFVLKKEERLLEPLKVNRYDHSSDTSNKISMMDSI